MATNVPQSVYPLSSDKGEPIPLDIVTPSWSTIIPLAAGAKLGLKLPEALNIISVHSDKVVRLTNGKATVVEPDPGNGGGTDPGNGGGTDPGTGDRVVLASGTLNNGTLQYNDFGGKTGLTFIAQQFGQPVTTDSDGYLLGITGPDQAYGFAFQVSGFDVLPAKLTAAMGFRFTTEVVGDTDPTEYGALVANAGTGVYMVNKVVKAEAGIIQLEWQMPKETVLPSSLIMAIWHTDRQRTIRFKSLEIYHIPSTAGNGGSTLPPEPEAPATTLVVNPPIAPSNTYTDFAYSFKGFGNQPDEIMQNSNGELSTLLQASGSPTWEFRTYYTNQYSEFYYTQSDIVVSFYGYRTSGKPISQIMCAMYDRMNAQSLGGNVAVSDSKGVMEVTVYNTGRNLGEQDIQFRPYLMDPIDSDDRFVITKLEVNFPGFKGASVVGALNTDATKVPGSIVANTFIVIEHTLYELAVGSDLLIENISDEGVNVLINGLVRWTQARGRGGYGVS